MLYVEFPPKTLQNWEGKSYSMAIPYIFDPKLYGTSNVYPIMIANPILKLKNTNMRDQRGLDVRTLPQGCVIGENQMDGQQVFNRPLQLFERLHKAASIAQFACGSSKGVESSMSTPCAMAKASMAQFA